MCTSPLLALTAVSLITSISNAAAIQTNDSVDDMDGVSTWTIDNERTSMVCAASHYGLSFVYGRFNKCSGSIQMDFQEPDSSVFRVEVDADSVDTNNASRDIAIRGPNCLNASQFKSIVFESTSVESEDKPVSTRKKKRTFQVTGNLTMHGVTRKITIPVELLAIGNGPNGNMRCGFMSRFVVNRSDFGIDKLKETVGESIAVTFCFQAVRQQAEAQQNPASLDLENTKPDGDNVDATSEMERLKDLFRSGIVDDESANEPGSLVKEDRED